MKHHTAIIATACLLAASSVSAHHSDAGLSMDTVAMLEGTITEFTWRNPHVYFSVAVTDAAGETVEWTVQMASTITVARMGWTPDSLAIGDRVRVGAHPALDGRPYGLFESIEKVGGVALPTSFDSESGEVEFEYAQSSVSATTIEGRWIADTSRLASYAGGLDAFTRSQLTLTEQGAAAQAAHDETSETDPQLRCLARPTPGLIFYTNLYPLEIQFNETGQTITIRSQFFDEQRTVYMDGRGHPQADERFYEGHSIGHWEGDVLVVDTTNFEDHPSPYQNGIPSGAQKHVVERYWLAEDGRRMVVEFVLEDPEYFVGSLSHRRELLYAPQMDMSPFDCDLESTGRYLSG